MPYRFHSNCKGIEGRTIECLESKGTVWLRLLRDRSSCCVKSGRGWVLAVRASAVERHERLQDLFCRSVGFVLSPWQVSCKTKSPQSTFAHSSLEESNSRTSLSLSQKAAPSALTQIGFWESARSCDICHLPPVAKNTVCSSRVQALRRWEWKCWRDWFNDCPNRGHYTYLDT